MPAPIVPPPMTPIWASGRGVAPLARAIFEALRSAKKIWRSAVDWVVSLRSMKAARSASKAASASRSKDRSTASIVATGESCPLALARMRVFSAS